MNLKRLENTPPWEWPENTATMLTDILRNRRAEPSDRIAAAGFAGEIVVMDESVADVLLSIVRSAEETEQLRARAAISLGPVLEQADTDGFEDDLSEPAISEKAFERINEELRQLYANESVPREVRRRVLEASVRAPRDWHPQAIRAAYSSGDEAWKLTAVFCMKYTSGFGKDIMEALDSPNPDIHYEAVSAAGNWELDSAFPHVAALIASEDTEKSLLLAAIEAAASIRPHEAAEVLGDLAGSGDEEIADAVNEVLLMAGARVGEFADEGED